MATKYKKGNDGYFQTKVWDGTYKNGVKHRVALRTKKSSRELERMVNEFKAEVEARKRVRKTEITFLDYAASWLNTYKTSKSNNTKEMYKNIIAKHFIILKGIQLQDIDRIHLQQALNHADGKKRTQQQIKMTFHQIIKSAVADHLFPANVAEDMFRNIESIKYKPKEKRPLSENERNAIFKANFTESDKIFVYLLYGCGIRRGEALALTIFDVNLRKKELTINKSHELINGTVTQKEPKSTNGNRVIPIPDKIFPAVESYILSLRSQSKTYLFTMRNGEPVNKSSYRRMWERITKAIQDVSKEPIKGLTAHIFRHNYCTMLCYQIPEISIKRIAQLLGDTEKMVLDVYNHIMLEKEDAELAVNRALI